MKLPKFFGKLKKPSASRKIGGLIIVRRVSGDSMLPALAPGQIVMASRWRRQFRPGDIVVLHHNGLEKIKRVAKVRSGEIFVLGDNPGQSTDSREFGWLSPPAVLGKVMWPRGESDSSYR